MILCGDHVSIGGDLRALGLLMGRAEDNAMSLEAFIENYLAHDEFTLLEQYRDSLETIIIPVRPHADRRLPVPVPVEFMTKLDRDFVHDN